MRTAGRTSRDAMMPKWTSLPRLDPKGHFRSLEPRADHPASRIPTRSQDPIPLSWIDIQDGSSAGCLPRSQLRAENEVVLVAPGWPGFHNDKSAPGVAGAAGRKRRPVYDRPVPGVVRSSTRDRRGWVGCTNPGHASGCGPESHRPRASLLLGRAMSVPLNAPLRLPNPTKADDPHTQRTTVTTPR